MIKHEGHIVVVEDNINNEDKILKLHPSYND